MYDATLFAIGKAEKSSIILSDLGLEPKQYALVTVHRAAASSRSLSSCRNARERNPVVLPLHPRTRRAASRMGMGLDGLKVIDPVGYLDMAKLLHRAVEVYTESGGLQKEAYFHSVPCTTLSDETEWTETITHGRNWLWKQLEYTQST